MVEKIKELNAKMERFMGEQMDLATKNFKANMAKIQKYHDETKNLMTKEGIIDQKRQEEAIEKIQKYLVNPVEAIVERFKVIRELKTRH